MERDGVRTFYEVYGTGDPAILLRAAVVDRAVPHLESPDPGFRPSPPRRRVRSAWQRPLRSTNDRRRVCGARARGRPGRRHGRGPRRPGGRGVAFLGGAALADRDDLAPDRVLGLVFISPAVPLAADPSDDGITSKRLTARRRVGALQPSFLGPRPAGIPPVLLRAVLLEPHSTKQVEDATGWGAEIGSKALILSHLAPALDEAATR